MTAVSAAVKSAVPSSAPNGRPPTLEWIDTADTAGAEPTLGVLRLIDQTRLPTELVFLDCRSVEQVWEAIKVLRVRGAPAIGVAAAYGVVLGVSAGRPVGEVCDYLASSRPTAVNLFWALERMRRAADSSPSPAELLTHLLAEARAIHAQDADWCARIGRHGANLLAELGLRAGDGIITHCNAGALATGGDGTALSVIYEAARRGLRLRVFADETRPLLQGARLTAWELAAAGVEVTVITDSMAAVVMAAGRARAVIVGADRIAANGDTANKIGTYGVSVLAAAHGLPMLVAAPSSTFDLSLPSGAGIPIEQRAATEVAEGFGRRTVPANVAVFNPAFDVTPAERLTAIVTELGVIRPVNAGSVSRHFSRELPASSPTGESS